MTYRVNRQRGSMSLDWLDAKLSFSFGIYRNAAMHSHEDLEIFMIPLQGRIEHRDTLGNHDIVCPGQVLMIRAGFGISHSQFNPSSVDTDHHLQLWIQPRQGGLEPFVKRQRFALRDNAWTLIASDSGDAGVFTVDQACRVMQGQMNATGVTLETNISTLEGVYLHVIDGICELTVGTQKELLGTGEAIAVAALEGCLEARALNGSASLLLIHFDVQRPHLQMK
jgi:quercetin 2,3-dioxygenase